MLGSAVFTDVAPGSFYDKAVGDMYALGIVKGKGSGTFDPDAPITRGEAAVMMQRMYNLIEGITETNSSSSRSSRSSSTSSSSSSSVSTTAGSLQFSVSTFSIVKSAPRASINVTRTGGSQGTVSVDFATVDGSAISGTNYNGATGTLTFAAGETSQTITITLKNTTAEGYNKDFKINLSNPTAGASLGTPSSITVNLLDTLGVNPSSSSSSSSSSGNSSSSSSTSSNGVMLEFSANAYAVSEDRGSINITVVRTGSTSAAAGVNYATSNGSATSGVEYSPSNGTLSFAAGETSKTFSVSVVNRGSIDGNKTVKLILSNPTGGSLGHNANATLTVLDKDIGQPTGSGSLSFGADDFPGPKNGLAYVSVIRTQSMTSTVAVNYIAIDRTAVTNADYTATSGTLTFLPGETVKYFAVPILAGAKSDRQVGLQLSNPTNGAVLGTTWTSTITVQ